MEKYKQTYSTFIKRYWDETQSGNSQYIIFLHDSKFVPSSCILEHLPKTEEGKEISFNTIELREKQQISFSPFLMWIKDSLASASDKHLESLFAEAEVYSPQKTVLKNIIKDNSPDEFFEIEFNDHIYYQKKFYQAVWRLLSILKKNSSGIIIIENANLLPASSLQMLLSAQQYNVPYLFILMGPSPDFTAEDEETWLHFIRKNEQNGIVLEQKKTAKSNIMLPDIKNVISISDKIKETHFSLQMGAFQDAERLAEILHEQYMESPDSYSNENIHSMFELLGKSQYYSEEINKARMNFHSLRELSKASGTYRYEILSNYYLGLCELKVGNTGNSAAFFNEGKEISTQYNIKTLIFRGLQFSLLADQRIRKWDQISAEKYFLEYVTLGTELKEYDALSLLIIDPYFYTYTDKHKLRYEYLNRGKALAEITGNERRKAQIYFKHGQNLLEDNNFEEAEISFAECLSLTEKLEDSNELASMLNGFGFFYYKTGKYQHGHALFLRSLRLLKEAHNVEEIYLTLYNLTVNAFVCGDLDHAENMCPKLREILQFVDPDATPFHSLAMVYTLIGLIHFKRNQLHKAFEYSMLIDSVLSKKSERQNEEKVFLKIFKALLQETDDNIKRAAVLFQEGFRFLNENKENLLYLIPFFCSEYTLFLHRNTLEHKEILSWGIDAAVSCGNVHFKYLLENFSEGQEPLLSLSAENSHYSSEIDWMLRSIKLQNRIENLYQNISDIELIYTLQNIISTTNNEKLLYTRFAELIYRTYKVDEIWLYKEIDSNFDRILPDNPMPLQIKKMNKLMDFLTLETSSLWIPFVQEKPDWKHLRLHYESLVYAPAKQADSWSLHVVCTGNSKTRQLREDFRHILSISTRQIVIAIDNINQKKEILKKNKALQAAATTDVLTNLNNRTSLNDRLQEELSRLKRYGFRSREGLCLLFIDLDNFKYYNDTFGHKAGDFLLTLFGKVLQKMAREVDFIARFGGDEFIMLLPETQQEGAEQVAERLLIQLKKHKGFEHKIGEYLGKKVSIPAEKHLSCSIGLSMCSKDSDISIEDLLHQSDKALYKAKKAGKNCYMS